MRKVLMIFGSASGVNTLQQMRDQLILNFKSLPVKFTIEPSMSGEEFELCIYTGVDKNGDQMAVIPAFLDYAMFSAAQSYCIGFEDSLEKNLMAEMIRVHKDD